MTYQIKYKNLYEDGSASEIQSAFISKKPTTQDLESFSAEVAEYNSIPGKRVTGALICDVTKY